jgi:hypothetical protein
MRQCRAALIRLGGAFPGNRALGVSPKFQATANNRARPPTVVGKSSFETSPTTYSNFKGPFLTRAWLRRRSFLGQWSRFSRYFLRCFRVSSVFDGGPGGKVGSWSCGGACRVGGFDF